MIFLQDIIAAVVQLDMQVVTVQRHFCAVNESVDYSHFPFQKHDQIREICHREQFWCIEWLQPDGVDFSSGIETDGVKDYEKMKQIVAIIRGGYHG